MNNNDEIKQFLFRQEFVTQKGTEVFACHLFARSREEAADLCAKIGAKLDGEFVGYADQMCAQSEGEEPHGAAEADFWPDEIPEK